MCVCVCVLMQAYLPVERTLDATREDSGSLTSPSPPALAANPIPNSKHLNLFMHLSCANGVAVVSNEIKTNGGTTQDGRDREGRVGEGRGKV